MFTIYVYFLQSVIDHETYFMNLTAANTYGDPRWQLLYRARRDLGMKSLEPKDWDNFVHRMARDPALANKWFRWVYVYSDEQKCIAYKCRLR